VLKNEANVEVSELQFVEWPLESGSRSKSITIDSHVKMSNFTAENKLFTAWSHNMFWSLYLGTSSMTTEQVVNFYVTHQLQ